MENLLNCPSRETFYELSARMFMPSSCRAVTKTYLLSEKLNDQDADANADFDADLG